MSRIILACPLAGVLGVPAKADETVKWRHVQHTASAQTQQVGDVNDHSLNLLRFPGIAFFPDGSMGATLVIGTSDAVSGVGGTADGYYTVKFADGSELWLKYILESDYFSSSSRSATHRLWSLSSLAIFDFE
jgi:hypothetical protein